MDQQRTLICRNGSTLPFERFAQLAARLAAQLPAHRYLVNLCEQREAFLLVFAAALIARQTQLLPASRATAAIDEVRGVYPDNHCMSDADVLRLSAVAPEVDAGFRQLATPEDDFPALIGFTSGSTGKSQAHCKRWQALANSARLNEVAIRAALGLRAADPAPSVLGTVPSHHMYGIELTVLLPLFAGMSIHADRPLFPADVAIAIAQCSRPRVLVSTPLHLRALADSQLSFPPLDLIISATAPLDGALAQHVETRLRAPLLEMFGATETCIFGQRRTVLQEPWRLYEGVTLEPLANATRVSAPWFERSQQLQDVLEPGDGRTFNLRGRNSDLIDVAGKRASLADITRRLCAIAGVADAVAFQPEQDSGVANRVAAVVVSRGPSAAQISRQLAAGLDAVFLPRPLVLVERIPRDQVGKVSRARLMELIRTESDALNVKS